MAPATRPIRGRTPVKVKLEVLRGNIIVISCIARHSREAGGSVRQAVGLLSASVQVRCVSLTQRFPMGSVTRNSGHKGDCYLFLCPVF